jgi:hypothetical protein
MMFIASPATARLVAYQTLLELASRDRARLVPPAPAEKRTETSDEPMPVRGRR